MIVYFTDFQDCFFNTRQRKAFLHKETALQYKKQLVKSGEYKSNEIKIVPMKVDMSL